jgi:hypothetical protein
MKISAEKVSSRIHSRIVVSKNNDGNEFRNYWCCFLLVVCVNTITCFAAVSVAGRTPAQREALVDSFSAIRTSYNIANRDNAAYQLVFNNGLSPIPSATCFSAVNSDSQSYETRIIPKDCNDGIESQKVWRSYRDSNGDRWWEMRRDAGSFDFYFDGNDDIGTVSRGMWHYNTIRQYGSDWYGINCINGDCRSAHFGEYNIDVLACPRGKDIGRYGCEDIDECMEVHECPSNSDCVNTDDEYECVCKSGK